MKMIHKEKNLILSNEVLDQYHLKLESVIQSKSLYLRPKLCLDDLSVWNPDSIATFEIEK